MHFVTSTYIHVGREWFLEASLKQGATHILWLDTDMSVPRELAVLLAMHDRPVVACNYRVRQGSGFTAHRGDGRGADPETSTGLEPSSMSAWARCSCGPTSSTGLGRPWFRHGLNDFGGDVGEDVMFCRGLARAGYTVYIDHDLSKKVGHIGQHDIPTLSAETVAVG